MLTTTAGRPPSNARRKILRSYPLFSSESIRRYTAIQRAARETERLRRLTHIAAMPVERLADQHTLDVLERKVFEFRRRARRRAQREISHADGVCLREENGALNRVAELPDISRPRMLQQLLHRRWIESLERLAISRGMQTQKMLRQRRDVLAALAQRRKLQFYGIETEKQILTKPAAADLFVQI